MRVHSVRISHVKSGKLSAWCAVCDLRIHIRPCARIRVIKRGNDVLSDREMTGYQQDRGLNDSVAG